MEADALSPADPSTFTVLTYNIHRALTPWRGKDIAREIHELLVGTCADIVCLQEVWRSDESSESALEREFRSVWGGLIFGKSAIFPRGSQGNAILSRFPVEEWTNRELPAGAAQGRAFVEATVEVHGTRVTVICTHLGLTAGARRRQFAVLARHIGSLPEDRPVVLAGDFNDWMRRLHAREVRASGLDEVLGRGGVTFPSFFPVLPLDRIYVRHCRAVSARLIAKKGLSDHLPVIARLSCEPRVPRHDGVSSRSCGDPASVPRDRPSA